MTELKPAPCPWCKSEAGIFMRSSEPTRRVRCRNIDCDARGPVADSGGNAIRQWNKVAEAHRERT